MPTPIEGYRPVLNAMSGYYNIMAMVFGRITHKVLEAIMETADD